MPEGRDGGVFLAFVLIGSACAQDRNEQGYVRARQFGDLSHTELPRGEFNARQSAACGEGGTTPVGEREFIRKPYLQKTTERSTSLSWTTAREGPFTLAVTDRAGVTVSDVEAHVDGSAELPDGKQWIAEISGLQPDTAYCYRLRNGTDDWTAPTGFFTAPPDEATVRFVALGDVGTATPDQLAVRDAMRNVKYDFAMIAGDVAYDNGKLAELERHFFGVYRSILETTPVFPASGNHDYNTDDAVPFRQAFTLFENGGEEGRERWYSFDWGPVHVAVIDTERIVDGQVSWLDADLAADDSPWTVVIGHRPPYSSGHHGNNDKVRDAFGPILAKHSVELALFGHDHHYERTVPIDGVTYVVTGGGGRGTAAVGQSEFTAHSERVAHFVFVEAGPERLRLVAVDATGQAFDSMVRDAD